jgi:hypothetical protein
LREERRLKVFENWVLRRIFGPKRDEVIGEWRKLRNEELNDLFSSQNVIRVMKLITRWAGYAARMRGEERCIQRLWWGYLRERDHLKNPGIDGRRILRWIFRKWDVGAWTELI